MAASFWHKRTIKVRLKSRSAFLSKRLNPLRSESFTEIFTWVSTFSVCHDDNPSYVEIFKRLHFMYLVSGGFLFAHVQTKIHRNIHSALRGKIAQLGESPSANTRWKYQSQFIIVAKSFPKTFCRVWIFEFVLQVHLLFNFNLLARVPYGSIWNDVNLYDCVCTSHLISRMFCVF